MSIAYKLQRIAPIRKQKHYGKYSDPNIYIILSVPYSKPQNPLQMCILQESPLEGFSDLTLSVS